MTQKSGPPPIVFILLALLLLGGGYWFFFMRNPTSSVNTADSGTPRIETSPVTSSEFTAPTTVPSGTTVRIDGSTSMVQINQNLKRGFEGQFPGTSIATNANGSDVGIQALLSNSVDVAGVSRPLSPQEQGQGLVAMPVATDAIAVVVGNANSFNKGLTSAQVKGIFQGQINNWSAVGGTPGTIRVINRPTISGTYQAFKELVLLGSNFGATSNITTLQRDATTPLLQALGKDGIGYATYAQIANQRTVRALAIDDTTPDSSNYPYQRDLYYAYKQPPSPAVQAFLGYASSPQGQQALVVGN